MMVIIWSAILGAVFGAGLAISQMMNPAKVVAFLDFAGDWDPTLAFVMAGAVLAALPGYILAKRRQAPVLTGSFQIPTRRDIDKPLVIGAALFGIGWGLSGFCPGPAVAALSSGLPLVFVFCIAMAAGMLVFRYFPAR